MHRPAQWTLNKKTLISKKNKQIVADNLHLIYKQQNNWYNEAQALLKWEQENELIFRGKNGLALLICLKIDC